MCIRDSQMRLENLDELLTSAFEFENLYEEDIEDPFTVLRDYLESIALFTDSDDVDKEDRILLMTLHNAKGLEFPVVFMTGMEENIFPSQRSETDFEIFVIVCRFLYNFVCFFSRISFFVNQI